MELRVIHSVMKTEISDENLWWSPARGPKIDYGRTPAPSSVAQKRL
jgi:hypothetical protein